MNPHVNSTFRPRRLGYFHLLLLVIVGLAACHRTVQCAEPSLFDQANRLYEEGKFKEAIPLYQSMLKAGWRSPAVLFNLGNAFFKAGDLGSAIYNYRRAAAISPRDPDIQANLAFARNHVEGTASVQPPIWERAVTYFTLNEVASVTAFFFWVWLILLSLEKWRPALKVTLRMYVSISGTVFVCLLILLGVGCASAREETAIVTVNQALVHLGPLQESQAAFNVSDGTELQVEARRGEFLQILDRSNRTGWISTNDVAVFPQPSRLP
jgi:tetratricopeptide (TPR) repeat protein